MPSHIEILGYDDRLNTIFARGVSGSVTLDIIPDSLNYLKSYPKCLKQINLELLLIWLN